MRGREKSTFNTDDNLICPRHYQPSSRADAKMMTTCWGGPVMLPACLLGCGRTMTFVLYFPVIGMGFLLRYETLFVYLWWKSHFYWLYNVIRKNTEINIYEFSDTRKSHNIFRKCEFSAMLRRSVWGNGSVLKWGLWPEEKGYKNIGDVLRLCCVCVCVYGCVLCALLPNMVGFYVCGRDIFSVLGSRNFYPIIIFLAVRRQQCFY